MYGMLYLLGEAYCVHGQAPCGQYYCRETANVSTNKGGGATRLLSSPDPTPQEGFFPQGVTI